MENTTDLILKLITEKEEMHRQKYKEYCEANSGYVMNGHLMAAENCKEIIELIKEKFNYDVSHSNIKLKPYSA